MKGGAKLTHSTKEMTKWEISSEQRTKNGATAIIREK
jgi:hypothetical protein